MVRRPSTGRVTVLGGGYARLRRPGLDRLPTPELPPGLRYEGTEGAGEVQTPLRGAAADERLSATGVVPPREGGRTGGTLRTGVATGGRRSMRRYADLPRRGPHLPLGRHTGHRGSDGRGMASDGPAEPGRRLRGLDSESAGVDIGDEDASTPRVNSSSITRWIPLGAPSPESRPNSSRAAVRTVGDSSPG